MAVILFVREVCIVLGFRTISGDLEYKVCNRYKVYLVIDVNQIRYVWLSAHHGWIFLASGWNSQHAFWLEQCAWNRSLYHIQNALNPQINTKYII